MEKNIFILILKGVLIAAFFAIIYNCIEVFSYSVTGGSYLRTYVFAIPFLGYMLMYIANLELDDSIHIKLKSIEDKYENKMIELNNKIDDLNEKIDSLNKLNK
ncbi:hypothetical protein [Crassaminicella profunda]|uniref:hypothetical protein n=1 Tax=Crassaminicella profunda TaxID=1286698 RepID=UPI001CA6D0BD|nr:hypothetical protein [Crassaminicella profunda]QZY53776.1 hypothetical protein K7H06_11970 [Crassaminicella profunda]